MANTYTQFYAYLVFAVKNRNALIKRQWKDDLKNTLPALFRTISTKCWQ